MCITWVVLANAKPGGSQDQDPEGWRQSQLADPSGQDGLGTARAVRAEDSTLLGECATSLTWTWPHWRLKPSAILGNTDKVSFQETVKKESLLGK